MRWARRDTFRLALFLCTMPRCPARMMTGSAALKAARAAVRSPLWIASSTLRTEFFSTERRPLFISVRRAITRVALRADLVLAIDLSFAAGAFGGYSRKRLGFTRSYGGENSPPSRLRLIVTPRAGVNVRQARGSGHAPGSHRVVTGDDGRAIGGREWCQRRSYASQPGVAMNMSKQRLHTRDQRPAVEQFADRDGRIERVGVALTPGSSAKIGVDIGSGRDATRENAGPCLDQACFG